MLGFLVRAQAIAEGVEGANRPLEKQPHVFHAEIPASLFFLPNTPIAPTPPVLIEQKVSCNPYPHTFGYHTRTSGGYLSNRSHGYYPLGLVRASANIGGIITQDIAPVGFGVEGRLIPVGQYQVELESGRVELNHWAIATSLRVLYTGGYDFSTNTPQVLAIKSAVAAILKYLLYVDGLIGAVEAGGDGQSGSGVGLVPIEIDVVDDIKVRYPDSLAGGGSGLIKGAYDNAIAYLKQFNRRRVYAH